MPILTAPSLGKLIAYAIKIKNLSYYKIKEDTGLESRQVQNMEGDTAGASMASYLKLCAYLEIQIDFGFNHKTLSTKEKRKVRKSAKEQFIPLTNESLPHNGLSSQEDCEHPEDQLVCKPGEAPFCRKCEKTLLP